MACKPKYKGKIYDSLEQLQQAISSPASNKLSKALSLPEMDLSFDKFRDLALLWKVYNPTNGLSSKFF